MHSHTHECAQSDILLNIHKHINFCNVRLNILVTLALLIKQKPKKKNIFILPKCVNKSFNVVQLNVQPILSFQTFIWLCTNNIWTVCAVCESLFLIFIQSVNVLLLIQYESTFKMHMYDPPNKSTFSTVEGTFRSLIQIINFQTFYSSNFSISCRIPRSI